MLDSQFVDFLCRAKRATYASGIAPGFSSRPGSHDLHYEESPFLYIDTYLGGFHFIGEEAVWKDIVNLWGMNYYGKMLCDDIPQGFSEFLKTALMKVPAEQPFRGPASFTAGDFLYTCSTTGDLLFFKGSEDIYYRSRLIYHLEFHGGEISD